MRPSTLPPVPSSVATSSGFPRFGTYRGGLPAVDYANLTGAYHASAARRLFQHKRWHYTFLATREIAAGFAVVDLTYSSAAFVVVVDLASKKPLLDESFLGLPGQAEVNDRPGDGLLVRFKSVGAAISLERPQGSDRYLVDIELSRLKGLWAPRMSWQGYVLTNATPTALTVIAPVKSSRVHMTQKSGGLLTFGELSVGRTRYSLDGGVAGFDYSNGYLDRRTAWRWAMGTGRLADGTPIALNLVEGFNDDGDDVNENALWVGDELFPLPRARFTLNARDPLDPWTIETDRKTLAMTGNGTDDEGEVALTFRPLHVHRENRDLRVVKNRLVQPVGYFSGTVGAVGKRWNLSRLAGVTEDQDVLW